MTTPFLHGVSERCSFASLDRKLTPQRVFHLQSQLPEKVQGIGLRCPGRSPPAGRGQRLLLRGKKMTHSDANWFYMHATSKQIELKSPGCSGFKRN